MGSPSVKEGLSAKYEHTSKFTLASQKVFSYILYKRPNEICLGGMVFLRKESYWGSPVQSGQIHYSHNTGTLGQW